MGLLILVVGIFSGLFVFISAVYSLAQAMLFEGWMQRAHLFSMIMVLVVMGALYQREVPLARAAAFPLIGAGLWTLWLEERWFKVFPLLTLFFAGVVAAGVVAR
ncbi:MAG: hypothetical protein AAF565_02635 [Pseudomonadota bacterium]